MTRPRPPRDLTHLLSQLERRLTARLRAVLEPEGCSIEEWRVLELLADGEGHTMTELADHALLLPPTLTKLIDRMASDNLVYRRADTEDRRKVRAHLTPRGRDRHQLLHRHVADSEAELLASISDRGELTDLLTHLSDVLDGKHRADVL
jgi:DNA-binding MarR family transcriptional regulator